MPSIATNAASSEIKRLVYKPRTISAGEFFWAGGTVAVTFGVANWFGVRRIARWRTADRSFEAV